jgi:glycosyltransferase involved in cell wall biosynthesis
MGWLPDTVKTFLKDARAAIHAYRFRKKGLDGPWEQSNVGLVWQRHDLFHTAGLHAARHFGCPLVLFVDAPVVWEARRWGVRRPGWGQLLEAVGEKPILRHADLVACVSEEVAEEVQRLGAASERVIVTPCSVDAEIFHREVDGSPVRARYGLDGRFVVGWTGSFRRFHGLEVLLDAFASLQNAVAEASLLLVGDGAERPRLEELTRRKGLHERVVFTGTVSHDEVPSHIGAMDVAVLTAPPNVGFHYSPLKLKEYMACGRAIVAPRLGQVPSSVSPGQDALLVDAGDATGLADALHELYADPELRAVLGMAAAKRVRADGVWEYQVNRAVERLTALSAS